MERPGCEEKFNAMRPAKSLGALCSQPLGTFSGIFEIYYEIFEILLIFKNNSKNLLVFSYIWGFKDLIRLFGWIIYT
jgi:hypothetical protein